MLSCRLNGQKSSPSFDTLVAMINDCNLEAKSEQQVLPFTPNVVHQNHGKCPRCRNERNNFAESMASQLLAEGTRHKTPPSSIWKFLQLYNNQINKLLIDVNSNEPGLSRHGDIACNRLSQVLFSRSTHRHASEEANKNMKKKVKMMIGVGVNAYPLLPTDNVDEILSNLCEKTIATNLIQMHVVLSSHMHPSEI